MTAELRAMLLVWLESGTDGQKRHAAYRLSLAEVDDGPAIPPLPDDPRPVPGVRLGGCCGG